VNLGLSGVLDLDREIRAIQAISDPMKEGITIYLAMAMSLSTGLLVLPLEINNTLPFAN
jgi:NhaP-type Na+/H+ and K+/H+ antiporter